MILNLLIIVFILFMAYWWGLQGLFSGLLHLVVVIVAGSLALAAWEPLVFLWGMPMKPEYSWGIWLVGPFILILLLLRILVDRLVRANVQFSQVINLVGGGACGVGAAILTAGLVLIGVGFLPLGRDLLWGYEPAVLDTQGTVVRNTSLWIPVDDAAAGFFAKLSDGAFSSGHSMRLYQPELARQAELYRLHPDPNATVSAVPQEVQVSGQFSARVADLKDLPATIAGKLGDKYKQPGMKLLIVDTFFHQNGVGTFDSDSALRVAPTQVRLIAWDKPDPEEATQGTVYAPVAAVHADPATKERDFIALTDRTMVCGTTPQREILGWVFVVPEDQTPRALLVRNTRLPLHGWVKSAPDEVIAKLGQIDTSAPGAADAGTTNPPPTGAAVGSPAGPPSSVDARYLQITADLPRPISINMATGLNFEANQVVDGESQVNPTTGLTREIRADKIQAASHQAVLRLELAHDRVLSLGAAQVGAAVSLNPPFLVDANGDPWWASGYVRLEPSDAQHIYFNRMTQIRSVRELHTSSMGRQDKLYVYFLVNKGVKIVSFNVGPAKYEVSLEVPK